MDRKRTITVVSVVLNLLLAGLLLLPACRQQKKDTSVHLPDSLLYPAEDSYVYESQRNESYYYVQQTLTMNYYPSPVDLAFVGDSHTRYFEWTDLVPEKVACIRAISGDTTDGLLDRLNTVTTLQPRNIFLSIGINDIINGILDGLDTPENADTTDAMELALENYARILEILYAECPGVQIYVFDVFPLGQRWCRSEDIRWFNGQLKTLCDDKGARFIEVSELLADDEGNLMAEYDLGDGIHLSPEGYKVWVEQLLPLLG